MERLTMLGTGIALVTKYQNTYFAIRRNENSILVDGGGGDGILRQFEKAGLNWSNLRHIIVSHEHTDHILGIIVAIRMICYQMLLGNYQGNCYVYCNRIVAEKLTAICGMLLRKAERALVGTRLHIVSVHDGEQKTIMEYPVTFFDTRSEKSMQYGFMLTLDSGHTLTFLGDEPFHDESAQYVKGADWLMCEAFCLYAHRHIHTPYQYHHSTVKEASELAEQNGVKNLILFHTEQATYGCRKELYTNESKKFFNGNIFIPDDLETIHLA